MTFQPSSTLRSPTFLGLVLAQITAAFNDQAIHITAFFFASDVLIRSAAALTRIDEKAVVALVTGCFITPFILFSPLAGQLADKYSKRRTLVAWKLAEVAMMAVGLFGLLLPTLPAFDFLDQTTRYRLAAGIVVGTVFLMGTHSAFFVPAKYGVMPEILKPAVLSRGNGVLEGTSFVAQILGTCFGAALYIALKRKGGGPYEPTNEWIIGAVLLGISVVGALATVVIGHMPPAAPDTKITLNWWKPVRNIFGVLGRSRPLLVAVLGIGFLAFMTLFMRQSLLYEGEMKKNLEMVQAAAKTTAAAAVAADEHEDPDHAAEVPLAGALAAGATEHEKAELRLAVLLAFVGLGIGIGSVLAGVLSGKKLELGLVPIGGALLVVLLLLAAFSQRQQSTAGMSACLVAIGASAGLYVVPLYTLMQDRAPKSSKGNMVAISNVVNMIFGVAALGAFYLCAGAVERLWGLTITPQAYNADLSLRDGYLHQLKSQILVPSVLFLLASALTVTMFVALGTLLPDLLLRAFLWLRSTRKARLRVDGLSRVPPSGPAVIASPAYTFAGNLPLLAAVDRRVWAVTFEEQPSGGLERLAGWSSLVRIKPGDVESLRRGVQKLVRALECHQAIALPTESLNGEASQLWSEVLKAAPAGTPVIPAALVGAKGRHDRSEFWVCFGEPLPAASDLPTAAAAGRHLAETSVE